LARFEFESGIALFYFSFTFVSFEESRLLVSWCAGGRCGMACSDEDRGRSRRPGAEDRGWSHRSGTRWPGGREVGWRRVRSAPDTWRLVSVGFLVEPQNQGGGGFPGLGLKTGSSVLVIWTSKSLRWFLGLDLKTKWASVCRLRHKTDGWRSAQDTCRDLVACLALK
jgi:hypothetical protein